METFKPVLDWLVQENSVYVLCGVIAALALTAMAWFWSRIIRVRRAFRDLLTRVEAIESEGAFVTAFPDLDQELQKSAFVGHGWGEFRDTLIHPGPSCSVFRNTEPPEFFFTSTAVASTALNLRLQFAIPGYLTGLGILGTFLGLSAGIFAAQSGLAVDDSSENRKALLQLLDGASLAFWTSVVGLVSSLILSISEKSALRGLDRQVTRWNGALERLLRRVTPEQVAVEQLAETQKQTIQLERFNTDLAVSIAEALESRVGRAIGQRFDSLIEGVAALKNQQVDFAETVLSKVGTQISDALTGAAGAEMRQMATTLQTRVGVLQDAASSLGSGHQKMVTSTDAAISRLADAVERSSSALSAGTAEAVERVVSRLEQAAAYTATQLAQAGEQSSTHIGKAATHFGAGADRLAGLLETTLRSGDKQREVIESAAATIERAELVARQFREVGTTVADALEKVRAAAASVTAASGSLGPVAISLHETTQTLQSSQAETARIWKNYDERFERVDRELKACVDELVQGVQTLATKSAQFSQEYDRQMAKALEGLSGVAKEISESIEDLAQSRGLNR